MMLSDHSNVPNGHIIWVSNTFPKVNGLKITAKKRFSMVHTIIPIVSVPIALLNYLILEESRHNHIYMHETMSLYQKGFLCLSIFQLTKTVLYVH